MLSYSSRFNYCIFLCKKKGEDGKSGMTGRDGKPGLDVSSANPSYWKYHCDNSKWAISLGPLEYIRITNIQ